MTDLPHDRSAPRLTVEPNESLPDVLNRVRSTPGQTVTLEIPDHSPIFLTATEFRTLREVADQSAVTLRLETADPLRVQLASMFGLVEAGPRARNRADAVPLPSSLSFNNWRKARGDQDAQAADAQPADADAEDPIAVSRKRRRTLAAAGQDEDRGRAEPEASVPVGEGALDYLDKDSRGLSARAAGRIVAVLGVVLLMLGISGWYYLPTISVQATLKTTNVETGMLYSVAAPGATVPGDVDFSVEAQQSSDNVQFSVTIPATGVQRQPKDTAKGVVTLRNASAEAVAVPAGTTLTTSTGISFTTGDAVDVPPGSKDGSTIGEVDVNVTAAKAGGTGNLAAGALSGRLEDLPVYFSNREQATSGGSDTEVKVVAQEDIDSLNATVENDIRQVVAEGWSKQLGNGISVVSPSVETDNLDVTIDKKAGDRADTVTLSGSADATGLTYDLATVEDQARESFTAALQGQVPDGYQLLASTVTLGTPELLSESPESVEYQVSATGTAQAVFNDQMRDDLVAGMTGDSWSGAVNDLNGVSAFASWSLEHSPGWWPKRLPQSPSRIDVSVDQTPPVSGTPGPSETPDEDAGN